VSRTSHIKKENARVKPGHDAHRVRYRCTRQAWWPGACGAVDQTFFFAK
jgi:hypothetical protein